MFDKAKVWRIVKWASAVLVVLGLIVGGIGILHGGLDAVNFLFWM